MHINNIEYDLDSLLKRHKANSLEAARELREATGVTLKEAFEILEKYENGILDKNSDVETRSQKFASSITSKILLAILVPSCILFIFIILLPSKEPSTDNNSTIVITQGQTKSEPLTTQQKSATYPVPTANQKPTTRTQEFTTESAVEHRTGENFTGISDKSLSGMHFAVNKVRNDKTGKWKVSTIAEDIDIEYYALAYAKLYIYDKSAVHAIVNFTRNTTTCITKDGNIIYVDIHSYVKGEEHDANLLFSGTLLHQYFIYADNGDIEKIY